MFYGKMTENRFLVKNRLQLHFLALFFLLSKNLDRKFSFDSSFLIELLEIEKVLYFCNNQRTKNKWNGQMKYWNL